MQRLKVFASCPSCGAPFEFLEGANVARCPFCNLPLLFQSPDSILRYYLEPKLGQKEVPFLIDRFRKQKGESLSKKINGLKLYYLPFWRFTCQAFYTLTSPAFSDDYEEAEEIKILTKEWDINFTGNTSNDLGLATLGMRPDWLKLRLLVDASSLKEGEILNSDVNSFAAKEKALRSLHSYLEEKKSSDQELVIALLQESQSVIYFPLWAANFQTAEGEYYQIFDGITKRMIKQVSGYIQLKEDKGQSSENPAKLRIIPHRCPDCGWDLPVTSFHLVFPCENCGKIWKICENGHQRIPGDIVRPEEEQKADYPKPPEFYPFWVFETRFQDKSFSIQNLAELFPSEIGWLRAKDKSRPFLFYVPAFEIKNLNKIPGISLAFTRTQPGLEKKSGEKAALRGASLSGNDAKKLAEFLWKSFVCSKMNLHVEAYKELMLDNGKLIWFPFYEEGIFLKDAVIGYAFQNAK